MHHTATSRTLLNHIARMHEASLVEAAFRTGDKVFQQRVQQTYAKILNQDERVSHAILVPAVLYSTRSAMHMVNAAEACGFCAGVGPDGSRRRIV